MKLNILSDLHLSCGLIAVPDTDADVVILAGDIGKPEQAIAWASGFDKPVLYVPGNHEFYGGSLDGTVSELKRLCEGTQIQVLDSEALVINGVRFLGTTLWTAQPPWRKGKTSCATLKKSASMTIASPSSYSPLLTVPRSARRKPTGWRSNWPRRTPGRRWSSRTMRLRSKAFIRALRAHR